MSTDQTSGPQQLVRVPRVLRPPLPGPRWLWIPPKPNLRGLLTPHGARPDSRRVGVLGMLVVTLGAVMLIMSFTSLDWRQRASNGGDNVGTIDFAALRQNLEHFPAAGRPAATVAYFTWLCWVLLLALIVVGFVANVPSPWSNGLRLTGFFLGMVGAAFTYYALTRYAQATHDLFGSSSGALDNSDLGIWFALFGYLLAGVGSAIGPMPGAKRA